MNKSIKLFILTLAFSLLAACGGGNAVEGKFNMKTTMMGVTLGNENVFLSSGKIKAAGGEVKVDKWTLEGDIHEAFDEMGNSLIKLQSNGDGTYNMLGLPAGDAVLTPL